MREKILNSDWHKKVDELLAIQTNRLEQILKPGGFDLVTAGVFTLDELKNLHTAKLAQIIQPHCVEFLKENYRKKTEILRLPVDEKTSSKLAEILEPKNRPILTSVSLDQLTKLSRSVLHQLLELKIYDLVQPSQTNSHFMSVDENDLDQFNFSEFLSIPITRLKQILQPELINYVESENKGNGLQAGNMLKNLAQIKTENLERVHVILSQHSKILQHISLLPLLKIDKNVLKLILENEEDLIKLSERHGKEYIEKFTDIKYSRLEQILKPQLFNTLYANPNKINELKTLHTENLKQMAASFKPSQGGLFSKKPEAPPEPVKIKAPRFGAGDENAGL
jgi:hypothetical protein